MTQKEIKIAELEIYNRNKIFINSSLDRGAFFQLSAKENTNHEEVSCVMVINSSSKDLYLDISKEKLTVPSGDIFISKIENGGFRNILQELAHDECIILTLCDHFQKNFGLHTLMHHKSNVHYYHLVKSTQKTAFLIQQIESICHQTDDFSFQKLLLNSRVFELLNTILMEVASEDHHTQSAHYDKIQLAKTIINQDLSKANTIPELAKIVGTNEQYLKKYFKMYYGQTIARYTMEIKMEHARKLLSEGALRVIDISRMLGYKHSTHFTTTFKKHFGFKPTRLR